MNNTILNWSGVDHKAIYLRQLKENPLYFDPNLHVWVTYSYDFCKAIFLSADAHVPEPVFNEANPLNNTASLLLHKMARLSNNAHHEVSRDAAMKLFQNLQKVAAAEMLEQVLRDILPGEPFDWVEVVGKQLPVRMLLRGMAFDEEDTGCIAANFPALAPIMSPNKTAEDIERINPVAEAFYDVVARHLRQSGLLTGEKDADELSICNLISVFIQCYDGGNGLLTNTLLNMMEYGYDDNTDWTGLVNETLRHDPPVHNTRRVAINNISIGGQTINKGESILLVLAAANLDDKVFNDPLSFDLLRANNDRNLTFGLGGHNCLAKYFCIQMAADGCKYLAGRYQNIQILQKEFEYEPQLNVRLIKQLMISLS